MDLETIIKSFESYQTPILILLPLTLLLLYFLSIRLRPGLRRIPGPFLASILPLDRLTTAAKGIQHHVHPFYHRRYGSMVRIGPNHISLSNSDLIPRIYGITTDFWKSEFYSLFDVRDTVTGTITPTVFSVRDEHYHKALKRPVASAYSTSTMRDFEPLVDECVRIFESKMMSKLGVDLDFGKWLHWFAWDVISSITFSNRLGFMEREEDVDGIIDAIEGRLAYNSVVGQSPWMHRYLLGNPVVAKAAMRVSKRVRRLGSAVFIVKFAAKQLERYSGKEGAFEDRNRDMLARFKRSRDGEQVMSDNELLSHASSNVFAGSDTTAITLRSIFFHLLKNLKAYEKAVAEVRAFHFEFDLVTYSESLQMTYVQACIKEGLRMHPAVGMLMERIVPKGGVTLDDVHLPAGAIVGINPWVATRDIDVYGLDADQFRPERWLEASPEKLKLMERNFLAFGSGARTCLGKNVSLFEISKLVPQVLCRFDITLADPNCELKMMDHWFVKQTGLVCRLSRPEGIQGA